MCRSILLLGEGDFSFTLSLCKILATRCPQRFVVYSTSFDSKDALDSKYKDAKAILRRIEQISMDESQVTVQVLHNIDSTRALVPQLSRELGSGVDINLSFDAVIFNFPHLGIEDAKMHSSMVAHSMHCIKQCFRDTNSAFYLSLAYQQAERWKVAQVGSRNQLSQESCIPFHRNDWPGYEIRRHINGKSFFERVDECAFFRFRAATVEERRPDVLAEVFAFLSSRRDDLDKSNNSKLPPSQITGTGVNDANKDNNGNSHENRKKKNKKKRKMVSMTEGKWNCDVDTAGSVLYKCSLCERKYKSESSVIAHVYCDHVIRQDEETLPNRLEQGKEGKEEKGQEESVSACTLCGKQFSGKQGLDAHMHAVHGNFGVLQPHWAASSLKRVREKREDSNEKESGDGYSGIEQNVLFDTDVDFGEFQYECSICGALFCSQSALSAHTLNGFQPEEKVAHLGCPCCEKKFHERRALAQHVSNKHPEAKSGAF